MDYKHCLLPGLLLLVSLIFFSCKTVVVENEVVENSNKNRPASDAYEVIIASVEKARISRMSSQRNIDNREWLMELVNLWADADQLFISLIYDALYYRNWDDDTKRKFLSLIIGNKMPDDNSGILNEMRQESFKELDYLIRQSLLLKENPWMVRDFYDEKSEFSYWYLLYIARSYDKQWQQDTVIPVMRNLIREDRITAASYVWLNKPEVLGSMEYEISASGYPWNRCLHLLTMGRYIRSEIIRLYPAGSVDTRSESMLF